MRKAHIGLTAFLVLLELSIALTPAFAPTWGPPSAVFVDWNDNLFPNLLQTSSGDVWLAFQKSSAASEDDIYLMTNNGFGWSGQIPLITGPDHDVTPSLAELVNGTIMMVWPGKRAGDYDLYTMSYTSGQWSSPSLLVTGVGDDFNPSLVRTFDGRVWLAWSRSTLANGGGDLYYKIFNGLSWGPEQTIPQATSIYEEKFPSLTQAKDGRVWLVYESNSVSNARIYYQTNNGTAWSNPSPLTTTNNADKWPSIAQDRDGTIWVFWGRELSTQDPTRPFQWDLFYKSSSSNGASWSADTTVAPEGATDDWHPSIMQARDKTLWVAWNSDRPSLYGTHNLYLVKSSQILTHDVSVLIEMAQDRPRSGDQFTPRVRINNLGDYDETTSLTVTIDGATIGSATTTIQAGRNTTYTYTWATAGKTLGAHTIQATTTSVTGETNTWDNSATSKFQIVPAGDVERNGNVNIADLAYVGASFGTIQPASSFNPHADLNADSRIDIADMAIVGSGFGQSVALAPDFYMSSNRYYASLGPGTSLDISLSAGSVGGLSSPLYLSVKGQGPGVTATITPRLIPLPGITTLRFEASSNPTIGTYPITVTATNGTFTRTLQLTLLVNPPPDFTLAASPTTATVVQGGSSTLMVTITSMFDFNSPVTLTAAGLPAGVSASYTPNPATPPSNGFITSTLTFTATPTASLGTSTITLTGTSGSILHSTTISLTVRAPPDFSVSASPNTLTMVQGGITSTTVTVTSFGGFNNPTSLTVSGLPSGVSGSFSVSPVTPPADGSVSSTLTLTASSSAALGTVTFTITGTSGSLVHTTSVSLTVNVPPDFSLQPSPPSLTLDKGGSGTIIISVISTGGFSQPVTLTVAGLPSGVTGTLSVNPVTPPANGAASTVLTLSASATATTGTFTVTVTGTSGSLTRGTTVSLTINPDNDFAVASLQPSLTVQQDSSGTVTITVTSIGIFNGTVTLSTSGLPSGASSTFNPNPVTPTPGGSVTSSLFISASATATTGTFTVTITGVSGTMSRSTTITLIINPKPDFTISANPTSVTIFRSGSSGTTTITLTSVAGFSSPITLSTSGLPSGVTSSFSTNPVTPTGTSTLSMTASATATLGTFTITITGTSGTLIHSTSISLTVNPNPFSGATIVYAGSTPSSIPRERTWDGTVWSSESSLTDSGSTIRWVKTAYSTTLSRPSERIVVTLSADGYLDAYVWNGNAWSVTNNIASVGTTANAYRSFDLVYEKTAGRVVLAYSSGGGAADIGYVIWDGAGWLGPYTLDFSASASGSRVNWVSMSAKPTAGSNEIVLIAIDGTNSDVYGAIWNGNSWSSQLQLETAVSITTEEAIAVEYEHLSGYATFVWGVTTDNAAIKSRQWNGTAWDAGTTSINGTNGTPNPNWIVLAADPVSDRLMLMVIDDASDLNTSSWDGSAWTVHAEHDSAVNTHANRAGFVVWESSGSKALLVWATDNTNLSYKTWTSSGGWTATSTFNYNGADGRWVQARRDPRNMGSAKILIAVSDINLDLFVVRWDGTSLVTGVTATTTLPSNSYECFDMSFQVLG